MKIYLHMQMGASESQCMGFHALESRKGFIQTNFLRGPGVKRVGEGSLERTPLERAVRHWKGFAPLDGGD